MSFVAIQDMERMLIIVKQPIIVKLLLSCLDILNYLGT